MQHDYMIELKMLILLLSILIVIFIINYGFLKLGMATYGHKKYGKIKKIKATNIIEVEYKNFIRQIKTKNIKVRYLVNEDNAQVINKMNKELLNKTIRYSKIYNFLDTFDLKKPIQTLKGMIWSGNTYNVQILDDEVGNIKYMPKLVVPGYDFVAYTIDKYNCKFNNDDIMGYYDKKIYKNYIH